MIINRTSSKINPGGSNLRILCKSSQNPGGQTSGMLLTFCLKTGGQTSGLVGSVQIGMGGSVGPDYTSEPSVLQRKSIGERVLTKLLDFVDTFINEVPTSPEVYPLSSESLGIAAEEDSKYGS